MSDIEEIPLLLPGRVPQRIITIEQHDRNNFSVVSGDAYAEHLTFDEVLGCVASLITPPHPVFLYTAQQNHQEWERWQERRSEPDVSMLEVGT
jgi:hypothetical protein